MTTTGTDPSLPSATASALRSTSGPVTSSRAARAGQRSSQAAQVDGEVLAGDGRHDDVIRSKSYTTERGRRPILYSSPFYFHWLFATRIDRESEQDPTKL